MKPVFTVADLEQVPPGGEVDVAPETLITPLALEEAERRGIRFHVVAAREIKDGANIAPRAGDLDLERVVRLAAEEILAYLDGAPGTNAAGGKRGNDVRSDSDLSRTEKRERTMPTGGIAGADCISGGPGVTHPDAGIAGLIDHTLLKPETSLGEIRNLCREAIHFGFASVCINPWYVPAAAELLHGTGVKVCAVVGFPFGATLPAIKIHEAEEAIKLGAQEIDMVLNIGALKSGQFDAVESDIRGVVDCCHRAGAICKVILETALLNAEQKVYACEASRRAGADFVKTSIGFSTAGATVEDVALMRSVAGSAMGVKAAGGVRTLVDLKRLVRAGATRIGTSASVKIMEQARSAEPASGISTDSAAAGN